MLPRTVKGRRNAAPIIRRLLTIKGQLGLLLKKGTTLVLITKIIMVWVQSDSMNHAV
jgi:hypothetical protein